MLNTKKDMITEFIDSLKLLYGLEKVVQTEDLKKDALNIEFGFDIRRIPSIFSSGVIIVSVPLRLIHDLDEAELTKYIGTAVFHGLHPNESRKSNNIRYNALMRTEEVEENDGYLCESQ